jgi:hypothetical protein
VPNDQNQTPLYSRVGLNTDNIIDQVQGGYVTDALNCVTSSFDGQAITYQNEASNTFCFIMPEGYKVIGRYNITQLTQVWYYLNNPTTGFSQIGYVASDNCTYIPVIDDSVPGSDLIGFDILYPIHKIVVKTTNCSTQQYWTDRFNVRRYIDLQNLPWKTGTTNQVDTNKMAVQPQFSTPEIATPQMAVGGILIEGDYQFAAQYANVRSEGLTSFYSVTNPVRIFLDNKLTLNYNELTNKAISVTINNLDTSGLFSYFNLVVIKTINSSTSVDFVGTFPIQGSTWNIVYSGNEQSNTNIQFTLAEVMRQFDYYDIAGDLCAVDQVLVYADLKKEEDISYQKIWNQVNIGWQTSQVPVGQRIGYTDGTVCANVEGYFRDEVYPLEGCFILDNGKQTPRCHIPGRAATAYDLSSVIPNADLTAIDIGICPPGPLPRWKVYNTGSLTGYLDGAADPCTGVKPWQYGEMSYWESTDKYPDNVDVWGLLANQFIRHHKFPDSLVTHIHDQDTSSAGTDSYLQYNHHVYPIGFLVDVQSLYNAIQSSTDLTDAEKRTIVGFKIMRGDRTGNNHVIAKGITYNCGKYTKEGTDYYYPNYPFNDVRPDPFISSTFVGDKSGANTATRLNDFQRSRFTFHSPDTHFYQASGIANSFLKLETAEYGSCKSHFVQVLNNAGEKLLTPNALELCLAAGIFSMIGINFSVATQIGSVTSVTTSISPTIQPENFFPSFNTMLEIIQKLIPYYNYGWQYNGIGYYSNYHPIPNDVGNKIRYIDFGGYITSGLNGTFGDDHSINNTNRESSVYISTNAALPYTHEQPALLVPQDTSRVSASEVGRCGTSVPFFEDISSYYTTLKRSLPGAYGQIFSYRPIDTGYNSKFVPNSTGGYDPALVYGGDCFINRFALKIKHPFFLKSTVNKTDGFDIDYNQDSASHTNTGNVGYPIWYYSTTNKSVDITDINAAVDAFKSQFTALGIVANILTGGIVGMVTLFRVMFAIINDALLGSLGIKITNPECYNSTNLYEQGQAYLYAYGIIYYFCESEVNVDMRQAYNLTDGNFYPNMGSDIPDPWLQETNTSIVYDNTYTYNKTYSKQNHETAFTLLRPDWAPDQTCYIDFNNRAIWSDQSSLEETKNNWLVYRPANLKDFPKNFGSLVGMDSTDNREVLIRYQNHYQIYNALSSIDTTGLTAAMGTGILFSTQPLDGPIADTGNQGTQNKFLLSTENGRVWIDALRGQVLLLRDHQTEELSGEKYLNSKWFTNNLPFNIMRNFPDYPIDNHYNGIGLHGTYDSFYKRLIITKLDYQLIDSSVQWDGTDFYTVTTVTETVPGAFACCPNGYTYNGVDCEAGGDPPIHTPAIQCPSQVVQNGKRTIVQLTNPTYFCNKSWTMTFSFISNSWISWHSYQPNFYVEHPNYFQAGWNEGKFADIWNYNLTFSSYQTFRGVAYPYFIQYPVNFQGMEQILQSIQDYCTVLKYSSFTQSTEPNEVIYYNKMIISNTQQCTGTLVLVPKDMSSMRQYREYPKYHTNYTEVLVSKSQHLYTVNQFWDKVIDQSQPIWQETCGSTTGRFTLYNSNLDYGVKSYKKYPIESKDTKVLLIQDLRTDLKFISRFVLTESQNNYI